jgi:hypothetical protein
MAGATVVLFVVILAFLVGRVHAGADPGLARTATPATQSAPPAAGGSSPGFGGGADPQSQGGDPSDPSDPFGQQEQANPNAAPGSNGPSDNFGNAVPDGQGGDGSRSIDPPSTHVS